MARPLRPIGRAREALHHVETTLPDLGAAQRLVGVVLGERLAACAQWWAISSQYWWKGTLETAEEILVVFKTTLGRAAELQRRIHELHPYEVPYVAASPIAQASPPYASWAASEVRARGNG